MFQVIGIVVEEQILLGLADFLAGHVQVVDRLAFHYMSLQVMQVGNDHGDKY